MLSVIEKWTKIAKEKNTELLAKGEIRGKKIEGGILRIENSFVKKGYKKAIKVGKKDESWWGESKDHTILVDYRNHQYQIPPEIAASSQRPDMCVYSKATKRVLFMELTSPFEENMNLWSVKKKIRYQQLLLDAQSNGWQTELRTIEVGVRGFVAVQALGFFRRMGFVAKDCNKIRKEISKTAIRCSHFIWLNRENKDWCNPARIGGESGEKKKKAS